MELIKRQRWENLFKKRLLVHVDAVKEFYAKMTVIHLKKKDIVKSKVRGVDLEFDNEKSATILVIKKGEEPKKYDFFEDTFLTMCKLTREDGIWWIGSGENRRRDDDEAAPEEEAEGDDEGNKDDFDWEARIDEATIEGESESDDQFYDAQVGEEEPMMKHHRRLSSPSFIFNFKQKIKNSQESTLGSYSRDARISKFQAEFERKRANKFHDELEKAKAENAKLLALLHKTQTKTHP
ncbi:hypothetical protein Dimus_022288 [Dionaea muscipula]